MPIYQFQCPGCGFREEVVRPIAARDAELTCGSCGTSPLKRQMNAPAFVKIQGGGTRNHRPLKMWSIEDRLQAKYGDNE